MLLLFFAVLVALVTCQENDFFFLVPPNQPAPGHEYGGIPNKGSQWVEGSTLRIEWLPSKKPGSVMSLLLAEKFKNTPDYGWERDHWIFQNESGITSFDWPVHWEGDRTEDSFFYLRMFFDIPEDGDLNSPETRQYGTWLFYIVPEDEEIAPPVTTTVPLVNGFSTTVVLSGQNVPAATWTLEDEQFSTTAAATTTSETAESEATSISEDNDSDATSPSTPIETSDPTAEAVTQTSSGGGLGKGAIAGIAVGAAIAVIGLLALAWFCLPFSAKKEADVEAPPPSYKATFAELDSPSMPTTAELETHGPSFKAELESPPPPDSKPQFDSRPPPVELA